MCMCVHVCAWMYMCVHVGCMCVHVGYMCVHVGYMCVHVGYMCVHVEYMCVHACTCDVSHAVRVLMVMMNRRAL